MAIFLTIWFLIILIGAEYNKEDNQSVFSKEFSLAIRGIAAVEIMLGHIGIETGSIILYPNRKAGILFVAIFFVLAGYGLMYSYEQKINYLDHFISKKLKRILIPAYVVYVLAIIISAILNRSSIEMISIFNLENFFINTNWYVWEILLLYLLFYIVYKYRWKYAQYIILTAIILFIFIAYFLQIDNPWYGSTLSFWFGIWYYRNQKKVTVFIKKYYFVLCGITAFILFLTIVTFFYFDDRNIIGNIFSRNIASVSFVILVIAFSYKVKLQNKISLWLGKFSYEIYLFHIAFVAVLKDIVLISPILYAIAVICATLMFAVLYNKCERKVLWFMDQKRQ